MGNIATLEDEVIFAEWKEHRRTAQRSLERSAKVFQHLGLADGFRSMPLLGVVGSKGKGTGGAYAAATLSASGRSVGLIASPGLITNQDRIRISGVTISDAMYGEMLTRLKQAISAIGPANIEDGYLSPSGLFMMGGLWLMQREGCRAAVVEAGIGGISDEISLLPLSGVLITQIFLEHAEVLGPTIADIARNKSGIIARSTGFVVSLPQRPEVGEVISGRCLEMGVPYYPLPDAPAVDADINYPPGFSRLNAIGGVRAGTELAARSWSAVLRRESIAEVVNSVSYPGRLSRHEVDGGLVIVDSAISRDGLTAALVYFRQDTGVLPDSVYLSIPSNKDFSGVCQELRALDQTVRVFVNMPRSHLPFPNRRDWPWGWIDLDDLPGRLRGSRILAVGTATFTAAVLEMLNVDATRIYVAPTS